MHTVVDLELAAPPERVWPHIADLAAYPSWMHLVHRVEVHEPTAGARDADAAADAAGDSADPIDEERSTGREAADATPTWDVELRARVGPFARSKRLCMARTVHEPMERVKFERAETDERDHAEWVLTATLVPAGDGSTLSMDLHYSGGLWTGGILDRVLENEIRKGKSALQSAVERGEPD